MKAIRGSIAPMIMEQPSYPTITKERAEPKLTRKHVPLSYEDINTNIQAISKEAITVYPKGQNIMSSISTSNMPQKGGMFPKLPHRIMEGGFFEHPVFLEKDLKVMKQVGNVEGRFTRNIPSQSNEPILPQGKKAVKDEVLHADFEGTKQDIRYQDRDDVRVRTAPVMQYEVYSTQKKIKEIEEDMINRGYRVNSQLHYSTQSNPVSSIRKDDHIINVNTIDDFHYSIDGRQSTVVQREREDNKKVLTKDIIKFNLESRKQMDADYSKRDIHTNFTPHDFSYIDYQSTPTFNPDGSRLESKVNVKQLNTIEWNTTQQPTQKRYDQRKDISGLRDISYLDVSSTSLPNQQNSNESNILPVVNTNQPLHYNATSTLSSNKRNVYDSSILNIPSQKVLQYDSTTLSIPDKQITNDSTILPVVNKNTPVQYSISASKGLPRAKDAPIYTNTDMITQRMSYDQTSIQSSNERKNTVETEQKSALKKMHTYDMYSSKTAGEAKSNTTFYIPNHSKSIQTYEQMTQGTPRTVVNEERQEMKIKGIKTITTSDFDARRTIPTMERLF